MEPATGLYLEGDEAGPLRVTGCVYDMLRLMSWERCVLLQKYL